jgi:Ca2+-binding EF-hand superfamily protein
MVRTLSLFALLAAFTLGARADDENQKKRSLIGDPEEMFKKMDANSDGKVTKDEFKKGFEKLAEKLPKLADKKDRLDQFVARIFGMIDIDSNESLSKEEFKKLSEFRKGKKNEK